MKTKIKEKISKISKIKVPKVKKVSEFNNEFKKATSTAIIAAFSFIIALAWKDVITSYISKITAYNQLNNDLISALLITGISVIGIMIITKIMAQKAEQ